ncbi:conserved hypothetical protein [Theileria orientalis strain Shintoku]|uniref:Uncharacterized protein n=1 Tax=Theileria orientalis strain Shintoku TaxID=869250 RepID=J4D8R0_THEOR|nr:conserved hypothetical protein [Theileria orientalis strain Shintoku]BAM40940.1 conserved hypothetical protein [Theileria orientalis strain Shintoku]|eukprot:XP_009691241.1 conserved hypothetical protein [Theileria orientalis strain Shintoku]
MLILCFELISNVFCLNQAKSKINIPYIAPDKNRKNKGTVILDGSKDGNGELPFVEIANADAYFYRSPQEYKDNSYIKKERELERIQSGSREHFDFINDLIGNLKARI